MLRDTVSMFLSHIDDLLFDIPLFVEFRLQLAFLHGDMLVEVAQSSLKFLVGSCTKLFCDSPTRTGDRLPASS